MRVDGGDELLVEKRFCGLGEMEDEAENEDGESDGEERGNNSRFSVLNKTPTYCASYWDAAWKSSSLHTHTRLVAIAQLLTIIQRSSQSAYAACESVAEYFSRAYVAVLGEKIFSDCSTVTTKRKLIYIEQESVRAKSVRMY